MKINNLFKKRREAATRKRAETSTKTAPAAFGKIKAAKVRKLEEENLKQLQKTQRAEFAKEVEAKNIQTHQLAAIAIADVESAEKAPRIPARKRSEGNRLNQATTIPSLTDLKKVSEDAAQHTVTLPISRTLAAMSATSVFFSDKKSVGVWGEKSGKWSNPAAWRSLASTLSRFSAPCSSNDSAPNSPQIPLPSWCTKVESGEYNSVFFLNDSASNFLDLPPIANSSNEEIPLSQVVFRLTRCGVVSKEGKPTSRFKSLKNCAKELNLTLFAATSFAPVVYAAACFLGDSDRRHGLIYVLERGVESLNSVIYDKVEKTGEKAKNELEFFGKRLALSVFPSIFRQSRLNVMNFDIKPANGLVSTNKKVLFVDFDASLTSRLVKSDDESFNACMLVNLLLFTAHIVCYADHFVASGFAAAVRKLLLELSSAPLPSWLVEARVKREYFREILEDSPIFSRTRLEIVTFAYFSSAQNFVRKFEPKYALNDANLIQQLLSFCIESILC